MYRATQTGTKFGIANKKGLFDEVGSIKHASIATKTATKSMSPTSGTL